MILLILALVLISSAASIGFYAATQFDRWSIYDDLTNEQRDSFGYVSGKMILWWVRYYGGQVLPNFIVKPLYGCLPCMGSLHSIYPVALAVVMYGLHPLMFVAMWPLVAVCTAGINYLVTLFWG